MCQSIEELTMLAEQGNRNAEYAVNRLRAKERQCENLRNELRVARAQLDKVNAERDGLSVNGIIDFIKGVMNQDGEITVTVRRCDPSKG